MEAFGKLLSFLLLQIYTFRVATSEEEEHIKRCFRRHEDIPTGYRPEFYEHWTWGKSTEIAKILDARESESESDDNIVTCSDTPDHDAMIFVTVKKL